MIASFFCLGPGGDTDRGLAALQHGRSVGSAFEQELSRAICRLLTIRLMCTDRYLGN